MTREGAAAVIDGGLDMDALLRGVARRRLTAGPSERMGGNVVYRVSAGWETAILANDPAACRADTAVALAECLEDPEFATIMIPRDAVITTALALRICARHAGEKTIFIEGEAHE